MRNGILMTVFVLALVNAGCSDREAVNDAQLPEKQYEIRDLSGEIPTSWNLEKLREEEAKAIEQLMARAKSDEFATYLKTVIETKRASVVSIRGDSVAADLVSRIYAIRDVIDARQQAAPPTPSYIFDPEDK
jgi:hypothetical protein